MKYAHEIWLGMPRHYCRIAKINIWNIEYFVYILLGRRTKHIMVMQQPKWSCTPVHFLSTSSLSRPSMIYNMFCVCNIWSMGNLSKLSVWLWRGWWSHHYPLIQLLSLPMNSKYHWYTRMAIPQHTILGKGYKPVGI